MLSKSLSLRTYSAVRCPSPSTFLRNLAASDPAFAAAWLDALGYAVDDLEHRAFTLAAQGDPRLIEFMLRCHRPEVYRERSELGVVGGIVLIPAKMPGAE